ncbi:Uncharacterized protein APZ42_034273, partial [Daphnia magna]
NGLKKSSRPSGEANSKAKATKDVKEKQLLNSIPKLSKFGFGKEADLNSNDSASASVLLDVDDEDNDEVEIESNVSSPLSNFLTDSPVSHENIHDDRVENNLGNHNVVDNDFHSCLGASNSTEAIVSVELERTNDAGLWGTLSQDDIDYWIKNGPEKSESCLEATRFFGIVQQLFSVFSGSTHRWSVLIKNIGPKKIVVKRLLDTRWSARADAVKALSFGYTEIRDALEELLKDLQQTPDTRQPNLYLTTCYFARLP